MEYISCNTIIIRKTPNNFLNLFTSVYIAIFAPMIAPNIPNIAVYIPNFISIFLFFIFTIIAIIDVGTKNIKLVACAICC